jgi:hypothetical protein
MSIGLLFLALLVSLPFLGAGVAMFGWQEPDMANVNAYVGLAAVPFSIIVITGIFMEYIRYAMYAGVGACLVVNADEAEAVPAPVPAPPKADAEPEAKAPEDVPEIAPEADADKADAKEQPPEEKSDADKASKDT